MGGITNRYSPMGSPLFLILADMIMDERKNTMFEKNLNSEYVTTIDLWMTSS